MTKSKQINHYRKSITAAEGSRYKRCKYCRHKHDGILLRCSIIGMEYSNAYAIADDHVCDQWMKA